MIDEHQVNEYYNKLKCSTDKVIESLFANAEIVSHDELLMLQKAHEKWCNDRKPKSAIVGKGLWISATPPSPLYHKTGIDFSISLEMCAYWGSLNKQFISYFDIKKSINSMFNNLGNDINDKFALMNFDYVMVVGSAITVCGMVEVCKDRKIDCYTPTPNINEFESPYTPDIFSQLYNCHKQNNLGYL